MEWEGSIAELIDWRQNNDFPPRFRSRLRSFRFWLYEEERIIQEEIDWVSRTGGKKRGTYEGMMNQVESWQPSKRHRDMEGSLRWEVEEKIEKENQDKEKEKPELIKSVNYFEKVGIEEKWLE